MRQSQLHCVSYSYCMVLIMCAYWCGVCSYGSRILAFIQVLMKKLDSLQHLVRTTAAKSQN